MIGLTQFEVTETVVLVFCPGDNYVTVELNIQQLELRKT